VNRYMAKSEFHRPLGKTELTIPPVVFRADALDESAHVLPDQTRRMVCGEWLERVTPPVFVQARADGRSNSSLSALGRILPKLDVAPRDIAINVEVDVLNQSRMPIDPNALRIRFDRACEQLGEFRPRLVTWQVTAAPGARVPWGELKTLVNVPAVGVRIASGDTATIESMRTDDEFCPDFVVLADCPTVMRHSSDELQFLDTFAERRIPVIAAGALQGGFLAGGPCLNGRHVDPNDPADQSAITWRKAFASLCHGHGVRPVYACVQFVLSLPAVIAVSLSTSHPSRVAENVEAATTPVPEALWESMKEEGLWEVS
jgi:aryl-alcohol dehydrogenase-like predicted oxidoreductase